MNETTKRMVELAEDDGTHAWLRVLKGPKVGIQFAVPREQVIEYAIGDEFCAKFESRNEKDTKWAVVSTLDKGDCQGS